MLDILDPPADRLSPQITESAVTPAVTLQDAATLATRFENGTKVVNLTAGLTAAAAIVIIVFATAG